VLKIIVESPLPTNRSYNLHGSSFCFSVKLILVYVSIISKTAYTDIFTDIENKLPRKDILKKYCINNATFNKLLTENNIIYSNKKTVINKPTKEELINLLETYSKSAIGRMFGVTCNAVIKWCKKYNIN
jgi:hypothetical protein